MTLDLQGYGGGILAFLHMGGILTSSSSSYPMTYGQSAILFWYKAIM
jgi:hypothetical protein